jgi:DNA-3-methyladenine glycosylase
MAANGPGKGRARRAFFARDVHVVARELLGRWLVHRERRGVVAGRIVEVEAYGGPEDAASHARPGPTERNAVMFGPPGRAYVYLIYGMHHCLNVVTGREGEAGAVLIRALEPRLGLARMARRRAVREERRLARGPGCLARALGIGIALNGADFTRGPLWISRGRTRRPGERVAESPRIGIRRAADRPWRYFLDGNPFVSGPGRTRSRVPARTGR